MEHDGRGKSMLADRVGTRADERTHRGSRTSIGVFVFALGVAVATWAHAEIKLGVAGPITGPQAASGVQLQQGVRQAVDDINAKGGVLGQKIVIELGDDMAEPKQGVSVANKFVGDGVKWVVGHFNSGVSIPASDVYLDAGSLMITPSATNPALTEKGSWNVFRTCGRDDQQGEVAAQYLAANFKGKRIAVVDDKTTYGKGLADATIAGLAKRGLAPVLHEGLNVGEKDFSAIVSKLKAVKADLVYMGSSYPEAALLRRQMGDQGVDAVMMGGDGIANSEFAAIAGAQAEGTLMTFGPDARLRPGAADVVKEILARGFDAEAYTLYSYAAVEVLAEAAEHVKSTDPKTMANYIHTGAPFETVLGTLSYDKNGDLQQAGYVIYAWKKASDGHITYFENQ